MREQVSREGRTIRFELVQSSSGADSAALCPAHLVVLR
jgi:hypothetical protein